MERPRHSDKRERVRWGLEPPKAFNKTPPYNTRSEDREERRRVGEDRGDDGGSVLSDLVAIRRERRKTNKDDERERIRATLPGSVHLWTRSRWRSPNRSGNRVRGVQRLAGFFFFRRFERKGKVTIFLLIDRFHK